jgi:hypothetical protein
MTLQLPHGTKVACRNAVRRNAQALLKQIAKPGQAIQLKMEVSSEIGVIFGTVCGLPNRESASMVAESVRTSCEGHPVIKLDSEYGLVTRGLSYVD